MNESAQQAISIGINVTIFVIALSVSITLIMGVKNLAETAYDFDASLPAGSRVVSVDRKERRTVKGSELVSYCANYMTKLNSQQDDYVVQIIKKNGQVISEASQLNTLSVDLNSEYEVEIDKYDNQGRLVVLLNEI